jgi:uncharacterized protein (TIGR03435 family)
MGAHTILTGAGGKVLLLISASLLALVLGLVATQSSLRAQSATGKPPTAERTQKQWEIDAGGKMEFEVASVKQDSVPPSDATRNSNVSLNSQDTFAPTGGLFSATNFPLYAYMAFAYKLSGENQAQSLLSQLPKWAMTERFDIQAKGAGNPTKDQFRLMMQALLADRFKLAIHLETKQLPVMALLLDKTGKLGPKIQPHPSDVPCSTAPLPPGSGPTPPTVAGGFPESCGAVNGWSTQNPPGRLRVGGRDVTIEMLSTLMTTGATGIDRPVLDKTGLTGRYDFIFEFTPQFNGPVPPGLDFTPDPTGPTFQQALKEQLGFKLVPQTGPVDIVVVDHVEEPSAN